MRRPCGAARSAATGGNRAQPVFLSADKGVPYGEVMAVLNLLRGAGYLKAALVRRARPLPPMPADMAGNTVTLIVPVAFSLR